METQSSIQHRATSGEREGEAHRASGDSSLISEKELVGLTVITADSQRIGTVVALRVDLTTWRVRFLEIRVDRAMHKELGIRRELLHRTTMALPSDIVHAIKDAVLLTVTTAELRTRAADVASMH